MKNQDPFLGITLTHKNAFILGVIHGLIIISFFWLGYYLGHSTGL
jgi:hypothetical protein